MSNTVLRVYVSLPEMFMVTCIYFILVAPLRFELRTDAVKERCTTNYARGQLFSALADDVGVEPTYFRLKI